MFATKGKSAPKLKTTDQDEQFEKLRSELVSFKKNCKLLNNQLVDFKHTVKELKSPLLRSLDEGMHFYESTSNEERGERLAVTSAAVAGYLDTIASETRELGDYLNARNQDMKILRERVADRDSLMQTLDSRSTAAAKLKDSKKVSVADAKVVEARKDFDAVDTLVREALSSFADQRFAELALRRKQFVRAQCTFFRGMTNAWQLVFAEDYPSAVPLVVPTAVLQKRKEAKKSEGKKEGKQAAKELKMKLKAEKKRLKEEKKAKKNKNSIGEEEECFQLNEDSLQVVVTGKEEGGEMPEEEEEEKEEEEEEEEVEEILHDENKHASDSHAPAASSFSEVPEDSEHSSSEEDASSSSSSQASSSSSSSSASDSSSLSDDSDPSVPVIQKAGVFLNRCFSLLEKGTYARSLRYCGRAMGLLNVAEHQKQLCLCASYALALRVLLRSAEIEASGASARNAALLAMYARFLASLPLKAPHRIVCLRLAIARNATLKNFGVAAQLIRQLLAMQPPDAAKLKRQGDYCQQQGFSNSNCLAVKYLCFRSLQPIGEDKAVLQCPSCRVLYSAERFESGATCMVCKQGSVEEFEP